MVLHKVRKGNDLKYLDGDFYTRLKDSSNSKIYLFFYLMIYVFSGKLSLVGAPLRFNTNEKNGKQWYKKGLTGLVQINQENIQNKECHRWRHGENLHSKCRDWRCGYKKLQRGGFLGKTGSGEVER